MKVSNMAKRRLWLLCLTVCLSMACNCILAQAGTGTNDIRLDVGDDAGSSNSSGQQISSDDIGHVYVTWLDKRNGYSDIYFNYSSDYGATWQTSDARLDTGDTPGASSSYNPQISSDGSGHVYVTWEDSRNSGSRDIYFNYSSDYGATWQTSDARLDTGNPAGVSTSLSPQISNDENGNVYVTYRDYRNGSYDIYFNYSSDYGATWQASDIRLDTGDTPGASTSDDHHISSDGSGHVYVTWSRLVETEEETSILIIRVITVLPGRLVTSRLDTGDTPGAHGSRRTTR